MGEVERTLGLKVVVALHAIAGVFALLGGLAFLLLGGTFAASMLGSRAAIAGGLVGIFVSVAGVLLLVMGVVSLLVAWGLWNLKGWAKWFATIVAALNVLSILTLNIVGLILGGLVLYFLWGDEKTKALFK